MSKTTEKVRCAGKTWNGGWGYPCANKGSLEFNGKHYCKLHHPPTEKAKQDARSEALRAKWADEEAKAAATAKEAAEQKRRADLFPELLGALKALKERLDACKGGICMSPTEVFDSFYQAVIDAAILKAEGKQ